MAAPWFCAPAFNKTAVQMLTARESDAHMVFSLTSPAFAGDQLIPRTYTCDGDGISPPLEWSGVPTGAKSLALSVDDPDSPAPDAPRRTWVHLVLYNVPVEATGLAAGIGIITDLPRGAREGLNDWKKVGYGGPCPPNGRHRYFHKLYALDVMLDDLKHPTKAQLERAMNGHVLAQAELIGTYEKSQR